jgi:hypothetical protein
MKPITSDNYLIRSFRTNKSWNYSFTYLSGSAPDVRIDLATEPPAFWDTFTSSSEGSNPDGIFPRQLYASVQHTFYTGSKQEVTGSRYIPIGNRNKGFFPTGSHFYVVNIAQEIFGEGIRPGTFELSAGSSTASIYDDGNGKLISSTNPNGVIGNIFYGSGIAIVSQDTGSYSSSLVTDRGLYMSTGSVINVEFSGIHTIYEHQILCTIEAGQYNFTSNPTIKLKALSGSLSGPTFTQTTGSRAADLIFSGTLEPYFTTIGLYNDQQELLAIAKFPKPIRRVTNTQQTVIVRFDA